MMSRYINNVDVTLYGINDITLRGLDISELDYQSQGYQYCVEVKFRNELGNDCGYRKTYFKEKQEIVEYLKSLLA